MAIIQVVGWLVSLLLLHASCACVRSLTAGTCEGNFTATCGEEEVEEGGWLAAYCKDDIGGYKESKLDLNEHVENVNGQLKCRRDGGAGAFGQSCVGMSVTAGDGAPPPGRLLASCLDKSGNLAPVSSLDLNVCVRNAHGSLSWSTCF